MIILIVGTIMSILNTELIEKQETISENGDSDASKNTTMDNIQKEETSPTIVLNGPLSDIMAKALNMVLSNESTMFNAMVLFKLHKDQQNKKVSADDLYVYSTSSDKLENDEAVINTLNTIKENSKDYKDVVISIEYNNITEHTQKFDKLCLESNYKVFGNIRYAARNILNKYYKIA